MIYLLFIIVSLHGDVKYYPVGRFEKKVDCVEKIGEMRERFSSQFYSHLKVEATCKGMR